MKTKWKIRLRRAIKNQPSEAMANKMVGEANEFRSCYIGENQKELKRRGFEFYEYDPQDGALHTGGEFIDVHGEDVMICWPCLTKNLGLTKRDF